MDSADSKMKFVPVTKDRWSDFETLFGKRGACHARISKARKVKATAGP